MKKEKFLMCALTLVTSALACSCSKEMAVDENVAPSNSPVALTRAAATVTPAVAVYVEQRSAHRQRLQAA